VYPHTSQPLSSSLPVCPCSYMIGTFPIPEQDLALIVLQFSWLQTYKSPTTIGQCHTGNWQAHATLELSLLHAGCVAHSSSRVGPRLRPHCYLGGPLLDIRISFIHFPPFAFDAILSMLHLSKLTLEHHCVAPHRPHPCRSCTQHHAHHNSSKFRAFWTCCSLLTTPCGSVTSSTTCVHVLHPASSTHHQHHHCPFALLSAFISISSCLVSPSRPLLSESHLKCHMNHQPSLADAKCAPH